LPILDLEVWVEREVEESDDGDGKRKKKQKIMHGFYRKSMASNRTVLERSAGPMSGKRATLMEETLRRLRNMTPEGRWEEKGEKITDWALMLQESGYNQGMRMMIIKRAVERYKKELQEHLEGKKIMYRSREERKKELEEKEGKSDKGSWFRQGDGREKVTGTLRVPTSRGSKLKEEIEMRVKENKGPEGYNVKVLEDGGRTVKSILMGGDPFPREKCGRKNCKVRRGECGETCYRLGQITKYLVPVVMTN
jgi:hypothetical protein